MIILIEACAEISLGQALTQKCFLSEVIGATADQWRILEIGPSESDSQQNKDYYTVEKQIASEPWMILDSTDLEFPLGFYNGNLVVFDNDKNEIKKAEFCINGEILRD